MEINSHDVRELANGTWFVLNVALAGLFIRYVAKRWREPYWYTIQEVAGAIGLSLYFIGSAIMRAWVWGDLLYGGQGDRMAWWSERIEVPLTAAAMAITGAVCCIRIFSDRRWGRFFWIGTACIAVLVPVLAHNLIPKPKTELPALLIPIVP